MPISKDLFLALLSMDAYNEGYGAGLEFPDVAADGTRSTIGQATVIKLKDIGISDAQYQAWQAAGFYAVAYKTTKDIGTKETGGVIPEGTALIAA